MTPTTSIETGLENADLAALKAAIDADLIKSLPNQSPIAQPLVDAMRYAVLGGGKRMRPMLLRAACHSCGGKPEHAVAASIAIECIHAYSLVHDDLPAMDNDAIRHGKPANHVEFGEATAIIAGDGLQTFAFQLLAGDQTNSSSQRSALVAELAQASGWLGMAGGQCMDMNSEGRALSLEELKSLHAAKTGALIQGALTMGAICADKSAATPEYQLMRQTGRTIGLAFQVMDDVLDATASTSVLGKPAGSDVLNHKSTFVTLMGVDEAKQYAETLLEAGLKALTASALQTRTLEALARKAVRRDH